MLLQSVPITVFDLISITELLKKTMNMLDKWVNFSAVFSDLHWCRYEKIQSARQY